MLLAPRSYPDGKRQRTQQDSGIVCIDIQWNDIPRDRIDWLRDIERPQQLRGNPPHIPLGEVDTWTHSTAAAVAVVM